MSEALEQPPVENLYQLKNGDWITLSDIRGVRYLEETVCLDEIIPHRVVVWIKDNPKIIEFETMEQAVAYRDKLAEDRNG